MTVSIAAYLDGLERAILESHAILAYIVQQHEITPSDGKLRIRARLRDRGLLEFFEYVALDMQGYVVRLGYSYHWQDADGRLLWRWDDVNHHPNLPYAPHHVHLSDGHVEGVINPPNLAAVLMQIEAFLNLAGGA